jgi:hypothetical protein
MVPVLAERARSECARSMRAGGSTYTHSVRIESAAQLAKDRYTDLLKWRKEEYP